MTLPSRSTHQAAEDELGPGWLLWNPGSGPETFDGKSPAFQIEVFPAAYKLHQLRAASSPAAKPVFPGICLQQTDALSAGMRLSAIGVGAPGIASLNG